jgi:hypothetical protein
MSEALAVNAATPLPRRRLPRTKSAMVAVRL